MNDCLQPSGGFIPVTVDAQGFIRNGYGVVHRESLSMNENLNWCDSFLEAKTLFPVGGDNCILELTPQGAGQKIWVTPDQEQVIRQRLTLWRTCYGEWTVSLLAKKEG